MTNRDDPMTSKPPYRAEHIGSLPRPERLMAARDEYAAKQISKEILNKVEDECIQDAVKMQERVGIHVVTDGEYRKRGWREFLYDKVRGFGPETVHRDFPIKLNDGTLAPTPIEPKVTARLERREPLTADDFAAVKAMTGKPVKATLGWRRASSHVISPGPQPRSSTDRTSARCRAARSANRRIVRFPG